MASSEGFSKISMEQNQETTCADTEMSLDKTTLHNGASNKNVSDTVGNDICVTADSDMTSNHTKDISGNDEKRETKTKRRECNKEDSGGDKKPPSKEFTELDKYWKVVEDNPSDFTGWTYLLQYVEQERNMETVRKAFDAFFVHYPYCYGYWKKYADLEKEPDKVEQVFKHGVKAVALSIDLWVHYLTFAANKYNSHADKISILRDLFEQALTAAGLDFRSDKLWEMYIKWEVDSGNLHRVTALYDRLLAIPTQLYRHHFDCFTEFINNHHPKDVLDVDEFLRLRNQVFVSKSALQTDVTADDDDTDSPLGGVEEPPPGLGAPPGEEPPPGTTETASKGDDAEVAPLREKILEQRRVMFEALQTEVSKRWTFEETVRRPYFHVKPLEKSQLKNWREYLDFEMSCGSYERIIVLFERCIITCALYEEFWLKYAKYQEPRGIEAIRHVLHRACNIHLPKKPHVHFTWAAYEERHGMYEEAAAVLHRLEKNMDGLAMVSLRCISLARRQGNFSHVDELYKDYISKSESAEVRGFYVIKYARYLAKVIGNIDAAKTILEDALDSDQSNHKLYLQLIDLQYQKSSVDEQEMLKLFGRAIDGPLPTEHRVAFSQRRLEFLEDFGSNVTRILDAYEEHQKILKELQATKKRKMSESQESTDKKTRTELAPDVTSSNYVQPTPVMQPYGDMNAAYSYPQHWGAYANPAGYGYQHPGWNNYAQQYYSAQ